MYSFNYNYSFCSRQEQCTCQFFPCGVQLLSKLCLTVGGEEQESHLQPPGQEHKSFRGFRLDPASQYNGN